MHGKIRIKTYTLEYCRKLINLSIHIITLKNLAIFSNKTFTKKQDIAHYTPNTNFAFTDKTLHFSHPSHIHFLKTDRITFYQQNIDYATFFNFKCN